jgi:hypothetical protein
MLILNSACSAYGKAYSKTSFLCMSTEFSTPFRLVRPNPTHFFGLNLILDPKFGLSWVRLALRVVKRVQLGRVGLK